MSLILIKLSWLLLFLSICVNSFSAELQSNNEYILPKTSIPYHYDLHFDVELGPKYEYNGRVNIKIQILQNVQNLVLHSHDLVVNTNRSYLKKDDGSNCIWNVIRATENSTNEFLTVTFSQTQQKPITRGNYILSLLFSGKYYNESNVSGFFLNPYKDRNNIERYFLSTHLAPIQSRYLFPCYDEPNLKATFKVKVTHPRNFHALSNMPVEYTEYSWQNFKTSTIFQTTPKMSTYILAIAVSQHQFLQAQYQGKPFRIYSQPGKLNETRFALRIILESFRHFENLFKVKYTLPKFDAIVVPIFQAAGMENWGLITYGNLTFVPNESTLSASSLREIVNLIAHEISHQWLGNLVTLDTWHYLWLNEGFGTYYGARITDLIYPKIRYMDHHMASDNLEILVADSKNETSESLNKPAYTIQEIWNKFNSISYNKGLAIIRFMKMSFEGYDQGITDYLNKFAYKNVVPSDYFTTMNKYANLQSGLTIQTIMSGWSSNPGYPLLNVYIEKKENKVLVTFSQKRFLIDDNLKISPTQEKWWIPITYALESNPNFEDLTIVEWLSDQNDNVTLEVNMNDEWLIVNLQKAAYLRVNYELNNWRKIISYLKGPNFEKIHPLNRVQLIDDSRNLANVQLLPESYSLDLLSYLKQEKDEVVIHALRVSLKEYTRFLNGTKIFPKYQAFLEDILTKEQVKQILDASKSEEIPKNREKFLENNYMEVEKWLEARY